MSHIKENTTILELLLKNLYNAPWPSNFSAEGFVHPDANIAVMQDAKEIGELDNEQQMAMAHALVKENTVLVGLPFHHTYIFPLFQEINHN